MTRERNRCIRAALLSSVVMMTGPALAAEVTPQRLLNPEPQNWLMNHRTYDGQRFSPLERINETNVVNGQDRVRMTGAPLAIKDKIIVGASGGDSGVRDWIAALDAATGRQLWLKYTIPAPGEPGSETWKDNSNAWRTGGGAVWVTGTYDAASNQTLWGTGNPVPMFDPFYRPGDNLYTNSVISYDPDTGKMNWYFQFTPVDQWDYDEVGTHILIDGQVGGQARKLITHSARNGFLYTMERANGAMVLAKPYMEVNWTK